MAYTKLRNATGIIVMLIMIDLSISLLLGVAGVSGGILASIFGVSPFDPLGLGGLIFSWMIGDLGITLLIGRCVISWGYRALLLLPYPFLMAVLFEASFYSAHMSYGGEIGRNIVELLSKKQPLKSIRIIMSISTIAYCAVSYFFYPSKPNIR